MNNYYGLMNILRLKKLSLESNFRQNYKIKDDYQLQILIHLVTNIVA